MTVLGMSTLGTILLIWAAVLAALVAALWLGTRRRRTRDSEPADRRGPQGDRRSGEPDRRIGLPDMRANKVERRAGPANRRSGTPDRRRTLGAVS